MNMSKCDALKFIDDLQLRARETNMLEQKAINELMLYLCDNDVTKCNIILQNLQIAIICDAMYQTMPDTYNYDDNEKIIDLCFNIMLRPLNYDTINDEIIKHHVEMSMIYYTNHTNEKIDHDLNFFIEINTLMIIENIATHILNEL